MYIFSEPLEVAFFPEFGDAEVHVSRSSGVSKVSNKENQGEDKQEHGGWWLMPSGTDLYVWLRHLQRLTFLSLPSAN